jgi:hypothetical protein
MERAVLGGLGSLVALLGCCLCPSIAGAAGGGTCTLNATAQLSPGLGATAGPFSVTFSGTLSNCQGTAPGTPTGGSVQAGLDGAPVPTGTGSCAMNSSSGYSINRWTDGKTTVVKFSAVGALAGLVLQGVVVDHVANGSKLFQTTEPTTPVGSSVLGVLVFTTSDPLACLPGAAGVSTATIQGQLAHAK